MIEQKTESLEETRLQIILMIFQIKCSELHVATAQHFIRNNPLFLHTYMSDKGYSSQDIEVYYNNHLIVAEVKPSSGDFKQFCKATFKSYEKGTKKLFVILNDIGNLKKQTKKGVTVLPISFRELLEVNLKAIEKQKQEDFV